jgi:glutaredoxin-like protein NrdH
MTKKLLVKSGVEFDVVDVTEDAEGLAKVRELGYSSAPVVFIGEDEHWSGFRPDRIKDYASQRLQGR